MTEDLETEPLDPTRVEAAWSTYEPSSDFADNIVATYFDDEPGARDPRRPRWIWAAALAAGLMLALGIGWVLQRGATVTDALEATHTETVALGDRAKAVARPGAKLRWSVHSDGTTRIDQDAGRVFYRVDHGERFDVVTPLGTITVTGTCFEVDLTTDPTMKTNSVRAGALGAALASALVVTVYEGGVVLANDEGRVDVAAGQAARATDARAPVRFDPDDPSHGGKETSATKKAKTPRKAPEAAGDPMAHIRRQARDLERIRQEKADQASRILELEEQVVALGGSTDPKSPEAKAARAKMCAIQSRGGNCPFLEPDQETLDEMARCATVKVDSFGIEYDREPPAPGTIAKRLGVTDPAEAKKLDAAANQQFEDYSQQLRAMYIELGGDETLAEDASGETLQSFIRDQLDPSLVRDIQRQIAQERAGQREPPTDISALSIEERVSRLFAESGNEFERLVSEQLGPERARELRGKNDGWPGSTSVNSGDCIDPQ